MPRKLKPASASTADANSKVVCTINAGATLGRTWRNITRALEAPDAIAPSTYNSSRAANTSARVRRVMIIEYTRPTASIAFVSPVPSPAMIAMAITIAGTATTVSTRRIPIRSTHPRKYPMVSPSGIPMINATATACAPASSAYRAPNISRLAMSRPTWSVPSQYSPDGSKRMS